MDSMKNSEYVELHSALDDANVERNLLLGTDEVMEMFELGWFHWRLLIISGLSFMADAMVIAFFLINRTT